MQYIIKGGNKLEGKIHISGNKNAVFPCVAAALLTDEEVVLENISQLKDTEVLIQILKKLGVSIQKSGSRLIIKASSIRHYTLPDKLMTKLRGSIVLVGSILSRVGKAVFWHPGGDIIGRRSIETHLEGFKALGASIKRNNLKYVVTLEKKDRSKIFDIFFKEASVTATENLILASVLGKQKVILKNCAKEPHVLDLCRMLTQMGAQITGIGTDRLEISGVDKLFGTKFRIGIDFIEVGTYMIAAVITQGKITIEGIDASDLRSIFIHLKEFGIQIEQKNDSIIVWADRLKSPAKITTNIWPGFPTDLMSVAMVLATQSKGVILCHDWMYESRMFFVDKLISMGAKIVLADPHRVLVSGPTKLRGRSLETPDIRAGMALVLAGLVAKGKSKINQSELIERGYEDVVGKLRSLGAEIERIDEKR
ncbi:UDP-N-acetylglucosamine 1-carboxyvinyltransferase [Candidatus Daviesbacteria bacterium]|nr:UDP-N-acetylglucosamine 1-carboxyvinyltransferase [Candidatus Daviesbacteria bacterium]